MSGTENSSQKMSKFVELIYIELRSSKVQFKVQIWHFGNEDKTEVFEFMKSLA